MKILIGMMIIVISSGKASSAGGMVITVDGGIGPATAMYIGNSIEEAGDQGYDYLIIKLNTPGGLLEATRDIVRDIMDAPLPVVVYVSPKGARAGSAGVFITMAGHVAAMAPGTNMGAAHPVGIGGQSPDSAGAMSDKITNDAAAFVRTIAQSRGRNDEWAEKAVRESVSATENEALDENVIDFVAENTNELLAKMDSMMVEVKGKEVMILSKNDELTPRLMDWREELLSLISDPNIAYIFLMIGIYGIFFELWNPGSIFPGTIGAICGIIAAYSLQMLPVNFAGLALIILSFIFFIIEIKVTSFGLLTVAGVISFLLGSVLLIDSPVEFMEISTSLIITATVVTLLFFLVLISLGIKAQYSKKTSGAESLEGEKGVAKTDIVAGEKGKVHVHGELWTALAEEEIKKGEKIEVVSVSGLTLKVKKTL
ncbi:MAG: NfeD family protein [Bacteroidota bacterium]